MRYKIIHLRRCLFFINLNNFRHETGNCVSNFSFKWMKHSNKQLSMARGKFSLWESKSVEWSFIKWYLAIPSWRYIFCRAKKTSSNCCLQKYSRFKSVLSKLSLLLGMKWGFKLKICKCLDPNSTNMSNFRPLEFVGRGSETQLKVGVKVNCTMYLNLNLNFTVLFYLYFEMCLTGDVFALKPTTPKFN